MSFRAATIYFFGLIAWLFSSAIHAQLPPFYSLGPAPEKDIYAAGALYFNAPRYSGGQEKKIVVVPSATVILTNGIFADVVNGVGRNFSTDSRFEFGPRVTIGLGRDEPAPLRGLGKIRDSINVGGFANYNATDRWQLQSSARYGSGYHHNGLSFDIGSSYDIFQQGPASVTAQVSAGYADRQYMQSFYGVSADQAVASGYSRYNPKAGVQSTSASLSVTAPVHEKALAFVSLGYTRLTGDAAQSPYVLRRTSPAVEASVAFSF